MNRTTRPRHAFRPAVDAAETRVLLSTGVAAALPARATVEAENVTTHKPTPPKVTGGAVKPGEKVGAPKGVIGEAWVTIVNQTGKAISSQLSLYPYENGAYIPYTFQAIKFGQKPPSFYSTLTTAHPTANFQVKFGSQSPIAMPNVGPSQPAAVEYQIFRSSDGPYYLFQPSTGRTIK